MRPATISPASTGASSLVIDSTTTVATAPSAEKRQHHPGKEGGQRHDRQREVADLDHLPGDQPRIVRRTEHVPDRDRGEHRKPANRRQGVEEGASDGGDEVHATDPM
jgi:hypothetical protein